MVEERLSSGSVLDPLVNNPRSDSRLAGEKRMAMELGENTYNSRKKIKIRDLCSGRRSEEVGTCCSDSLECERTKGQFHFLDNEECSQLTEVPVNMASDTFQSEITGQNMLSHSENVDSLSLHRGAPLVANRNKVCDTNVVTSRGIGLDINSDVSYSAEQDPFYPYKIPGHVKFRDALECGSSTGPLEETGSLRMCNEMKQNGFVSSSHGGIPMPKPRGRKKKSDILKQKMEIAKREQVTRFTKIAAPSGLLKGLNPGIINHVRNSKQVHSIIEALVRSRKHENDVQSRSDEQVNKGINENEKDPSNMCDSGDCESQLAFDNEKEYTISEHMQTRESCVPSCVYTTSCSSQPKSAYGPLDIAEKSCCHEYSGVSHVTLDHLDEKLKLKLALPLRMDVENSSVTNEEFVSQASVLDLSIKAANVASQWLKILDQDIRGRLAALRRSKKRVQAVILTELPFLLSKEFSSNKENDQHSNQTSSDRCWGMAIPDMHRTRWTALFDQMEKSLSEEGKHLEIWLNQVKVMQSQCEQGLQLGQGCSLQLLGGPGNDPRFKKENMMKFAVRAAAASIYSTCNLVTSKPKDDVSCF